MNKSIIYKAKEDKDIQEDLRKLKVLQKEPCEDCISREHLLEEIASLKESPWFKDDTNCAMAIRKEAIEIVEDLCIRKEPSVNPQKPVLDKIRAEIQAKYESIPGNPWRFKEYDDGWVMALEYTLEVIDKHIGKESE